MLYFIVRRYHHTVQKPIMTKSFAPCLQITNEAFCKLVKFLISLMMFFRV